MSTKLKVAVIGLGQIGSVVAANLVKGNRPVILADRSVEKAKALAGKLGSLAEAAEIPSAITKADIIVFSIWFDAIKELLKTYGAELQGKIVVDPSNPIAPDENGGFKKTIGQKESAGKILSAVLPSSRLLFVLPLAPLEYFTPLFVWHLPFSTSTCLLVDPRTGHLPLLQLFFGHKVAGYDPRAKTWPGYTEVRG